MATHAPCPRGTHTDHSHQTLSSYTQLHPYTISLCYITVNNFGMNSSMYMYYIYLFRSQSTPVTMNLLWLAQ